MVASNSTSVCLKDHLLIRKTGDEKWRHAVVVGFLPGNALWLLTAGRSIELVGVSAGTRRDGKIWDGARLPRSVAEDSAAKGDRSVRGAFSLDELEGAVRLAAAQPVDSDAGTRVPFPQRRF